jgi:acetylornithine deacetylase/succinyl-diaminopimelate desuccinylase-like protein
MQRADIWLPPQGHPGKRVLLLGHIDTVLRGEKFRRDGDKAFGTGTSDMKAAMWCCCLR